MNVVTTRARCAVEHGREIADVVGVHVRDPDPVELSRVDQALEGGDELGAQGRQSGVDQHRSRSADQIGIAGQQAEAGHRDPGADEPGFVCNAAGLEDIGSALRYLAHPDRRRTRRRRDRCTRRRLGQRGGAFGCPEPARARE
jgi:hypothetical protein